MFQRTATDIFGERRLWFTTTFAWFLRVSANLFVILCFFVAFSKLGRGRLGGDGERPKYTDPAWLAMLFAAGVGIGLMFFGPPLAEITIEFQSPEKFMVVILAFATVSSIAGKSLIKGLLAVVFGVMLATVGTDLQTGVVRYTFGELKLQEGLDFVIIAIGLFAVSEVLSLLEDKVMGEDTVFVKADRIWVSFKEFMFSLGAIIRGSLIGFFIGVPPGTGASVAGFMSYGLERRLSDRDGTFGKGDIR